jgi:hypothetical protein
MGVSGPAVDTPVSQVLQAVLRPPRATGLTAVTALVRAVVCAPSLAAVGRHATAANGRLSVEPRQDHGTGPL